jgi:hypothetical protein
MNLLPGGYPEERTEKGIKLNTTPIIKFENMNF